jgi:Na+(H+)/acetate symporter ActP
MEVVAIIGLLATLVLGVLVVTALGSILNGWVLSILWGWFMVPIFHLPTLSIPAALGIALIIGYLTKQSTPTDAKDEERSSGEKFGRLLVIIVGRPLAALLVGSVVHLFV